MKQQAAESKAAAERSAQKSTRRGSGWSPQAQKEAAKEKARLLDAAGKDVRGSARRPPPRQRAKNLRWKQR